MPLFTGTQSNVQINFNAGVDPTTAAHLISADSVQTATNIDFSMVPGALCPRRGSIPTGTALTTVGLSKIYRSYNTEGFINNNPFYINDVQGNVYRGTLGGPWTNIGNGGNNLGSPMAINNYQQYAFIASGTLAVKDDGTNTTQWIKQVPAAPVLVPSTLSPRTLYTLGTFSITDGTATGSATNSIGLVTDGTFAGVCEIDFGGAINLNTNSGNTIGNFGVHFVDLAFSDPNLITNVSWDYSLGDNSFSNYLHAEIDPNNGTASIAQPTSNAIVNSQILSGTNTSNPLTSEQTNAILTQLNQYNFSPLSEIVNISNSLSPWGVPVTAYSLIGTYGGSLGAPLFSSVYALRLSFTCTSTCTITIANPAIYGAENFPLTDTTVGYTYWQTWATTNTAGAKIDESAPSPPRGPFTMQNAQVEVIMNGTATGANHGINAVITYREGGYMQDAYAVSTQSYASTVVSTDTQNDIAVLSNNNVMLRNLIPPTQFPNLIASIADPTGSRLFIAAQNNVYWTLPGLVGAFPETSTVQVSHQGDDVQALIAWSPGFVIVNRYSVFEMYGGNYEAGDYYLNRSGARRGSIAPRVCIKTPYGVPLLNYDGMSLYTPGYGVDQEIAWLTQKYGDMFRGNANTDPAAWKGNRIPAIARSGIQNCCAAYMEGKIYLAAPTGFGNGTDPDTIFVIDLINQRCYWYRYNWLGFFDSIFWDYQNNAMYIGDTLGSLMEIEIGQQDIREDFSQIPIVWSAKTKQWTANTDTVLENISIDAQGTNIAISAFYDNLTAPVVGTFSSTSRAYYTPPLNGTFINNVEFDITGTTSHTSTGSLEAFYGINFSLMSEPVKVDYWKTEYDLHNYEGDKLWDVAYFDIENRVSPGSNPITAVTFIDNTAVMTNTFTTPIGGRVVFEAAFPPETYGRVAYTTYTSTTSLTQFKHWQTHYDARNEPPKVNYWRTDIESLDENICDGFDVDINPNGTVFGTCYVDNNPQLGAYLGTFTGTKRQAFTWTLPEELYGRTIYVAYTGTAFKHYKTWFHLRPEPDRWFNYVSPRVSMTEHEWKMFTPEVNPLGGTVLGTPFVDGTSYGTYTMTGSLRERFVFSLPTYLFGKTVWADYQGTNGTTPTVFKYYKTQQSAFGAINSHEFVGDQEPDRVTLYRTGPYPFPSSNYLKTWLPQLDPINGTVTGTLIVDDSVLAVQTFTGNRKQWFTVGLDNTGIGALLPLETGSRWEAIYSASTPYKHYQTQMESEAKPFGKFTWAFSYKRLGGADQIDLARFWSCQMETQGPSSPSYVWAIDGTNFLSGTLTLTGGPQWIDRIPFPSGGRGYLYEFSLNFNTTPGKVYKVNLEFMQEGIKGLSRRTEAGAPESKDGS